MPTYEYECESCGKHFEYFQSMKDAPKEACEECGGHLKRLLSAGSGLIFKGSGFYITDYTPRKPTDGASASGESGAAPSSSPAPAKSDSPAPSTPASPASSSPSPKPTSGS